MEIFIDSDNRKRQGIINQCPICGKKFITRKDQPRTHCSRECVYQKQKKPLKSFQCAWCAKTFYRKKRNDSKSGLCFCNRKCKESAQKIGGITAIMPPHYGTGKKQGTDSYCFYHFVGA